MAVSNAEHGINRTSTTNGSGDFLFASLPIGAYDLTVTGEGFKKYEAKGITLVIAQKARVNVTLQVGTISTEVIVQGSEVAQVETQSSDLGNTISGKEISQLELNGRDFTQLVTLSPGVTNQSGQDEGGEGATTVAFSINGGRTEYNNFEIDGGDALDNGSNTTINVYPSIDAIAEVKVLTSNYGAQYGKNGSGTVEVETKSGTNHFHGDLYEFLRNDAFNATQFGLTSVPEYKKNDFGFTIGGPVYIPGHYNSDKQKTFFFWSEEWRRDLTPASSFFSQTIVPTTADRTGEFQRPVHGRGLEPGMPSGSPVDQWFAPHWRPGAGPAVSWESSADSECRDRFRADRADSRAQRNLFRRSGGSMVRDSHAPHALAPGTVQDRSQHQRQTSRQLPLHSRFLESTIPGSSVDRRHDFPNHSDEFQ